MRVLAERVDERRRRPAPSRGRRPRRRRARGRRALSTSSGTELGRPRRAPRRCRDRRRRRGSRPSRPVLAVRPRRRALAGVELAVLLVATSLMPAKIGLRLAAAAALAVLQALGLEHLGASTCRVNLRAPRSSARPDRRCRTGAGSTRRSRAPGRAGRSCRGTCASGRCGPRARPSGRTRTPPRSRGTG